MYAGSIDDIDRYRYRYCMDWIVTCKRVLRHMHIYIYTHENKYIHMYRYTTSIVVRTHSAMLNINGYWMLLASKRGFRLANHRKSYFNGFSLRFSWV